MQAYSRATVRLAFSIAICIDIYSFDAVQLLLQLLVFHLQTFDFFCKGVHLFFCSSTEFLYDFEDPPQPQNNHNRSDLLEHTFETDIDDESSNNDESIEAVKPRLEVPISVSAHVVHR